MTEFPIRLRALLVVASIAGCSTTPVQVPQCPVCPSVPVPEKPAAPAFVASSWSALPGWKQDDVRQAWDALLRSCGAMRSPESQSWAPVCDAARKAPAKASASHLRGFFEKHTQPWQIQNADGTGTGVVTGYYEPLIRGSRTRTERYDVPVHGVPDDLIVVDLGMQYPELKNMRLRGRLEGRRLVPYWTREEMQARGTPAKVLLWAEDPIEFFFLQVQGSGQVQLPDGSRIRLAYADQNGHPYNSIGRWLIQQGELTLDKASMQGIQAWAKANPARLAELLNANPSYVFFNEQPAGGDGPRGSLNVPLTAGRSIAVDSRTVPLGAPVFLSTTQPDGRPLQRLVMAQDTGGAIKGRVRADYYWGFGAEAGTQAGRMNHQGRMWLLWPKGSVPTGQ